VVGSGRVEHGGMVVVNSHRELGRLSQRH
jgi:hypothetical protein